MRYTLPEIFWPALLSTLAAISLFMGVTGVVKGSQTAKASGADALMMYPAPAPWLRGRPITARWINRIGRLYLMAALGFGTAAALVSLNLSTSTAAARTCKPIAEAIAAGEWTGSPMRLATAVHHTGGCQVTVLDRDDTTWFTVSSAPAAGLIGEDFNHQRAQRERQGMTITGLSGIGNRALLASHTNQSSSNSAVLFEGLDGTTVVEINGQMVTPAETEKAIDIIRSTNATHRQESM